MKVMVIDDEPVHVRGIMKYVNWSKLGVDQVVGAYSVKEALRKFREEVFELVITDINMPEINGLELIQRIYLRGKRPDIIIVSGYNEFAYAQEAIRLGVSAYILKPVKPEEIEENIRILSEKRKWETEKQDEEGAAQLLNEIWTGKETASDVGRGKQIHPAIQRVMIYISKNYAEEITLCEIAEQFKMNESYLSTLFKKEIGITITNYLKRYRLHRAMELLKHSELRINEIAYRVGYQNPCYFTEQFKNLFDITPSEIRKNFTTV